MADFTVTTSRADVAPLERVPERTCISNSIPVLLDRVDAIVEAEDRLCEMAYGDPKFVPLQIAIIAERIAAAALAQQIIDLRAQHPSDGLLVGITYAIRQILLSDDHAHIREMSSMVLDDDAYLPIVGDPMTEVVAELVHAARERVIALVAGIAVPVPPVARLPQSSLVHPRRRSALH